jgi:hypothetical protein
MKTELEYSAPPFSLLFEPSLEKVQYLRYLPMKNHFRRAVRRLDVDSTYNVYKRNFYEGWYHLYWTLILRLETREREREDSSMYCFTVSKKTSIVRMKISIIIYIVLLELSNGDKIVGIVGRMVDVIRYHEWNLIIPVHTIFLTLFNHFFLYRHYDVCTVHFSLSKKKDLKLIQRVWRLALWTLDRHRNMEGSRKKPQGSVIIKPTYPSPPPKYRY